jgi:hypothetical protein
MQRVRASGACRLRLHGHYAQPATEHYAADSAAAPPSGLNVGVAAAAPADAPERARRDASLDVRVSMLA